MGSFFLIYLTSVTSNSNEKLACKEKKIPDISNYYPVDHNTIITLPSTKIHNILYLQICVFYYIHSYTFLNFRNYAHIIGYFYAIRKHSFQSSI